VPGDRINHPLPKKGLEMMPLNLAEIGEENTIKKIGGNPEIRTHLENLGFQVGGTVSIVNTVNGNIIVKVKESRIAIGEDMARKIMI
jgi:ferrous iron transport protein A